jgi:hypothetical protein
MKDDASKSKRRSVVIVCLYPRESTLNLNLAEAIGFGGRNNTLV